MITCSLCNSKVLVKGLCRIHYAQEIRKNMPKYPRNIGRYKKSNAICRVPGCNLPVQSWGVCSKHYERWRKYRNFDYVKPFPSGKDNNFWKGGIFPYKKQSVMKQRRKEKIIQTNGKCELCGNNGYHLHHKDNSKTNHSIDNLLFLCAKCHGKLHKGRKNKTSKFIRLYGKSLYDLAKEFNVSMSKIYLIHKLGLLGNYITKNYTKNH